MASCHLCAQAQCVANVVFFSIVIKQDQPVEKNSTSICSGNGDLVLITV